MNQEYQGISVVDKIVRWAINYQRPVKPAQAQLLTYFAQAWHLALEQEPLFTEPIIAGPEGPTIRTVQTVLQNRPAIPLRWTLLPVPTALPDASESIILAVWRKYGEESAPILTHRASAPNSPWEETLKRGEQIIAVDTIREHYRKLLAARGARQ